MQGTWESKIDKYIYIFIYATAVPPSYKYRLVRHYVFQVYTHRFWFVEFPSTSYRSSSNSDPGAQSSRVSLLPIMIRVLHFHREKKEWHRTARLPTLLGALRTGPFLKEMVFCKCSPMISVNCLDHVPFKFAKLTLQAFEGTPSPSGQLA